MKKKEYTFIVTGYYGSQLGTIVITTDGNLPTHKEICKACKDIYPQAYTYRLVSKKEVLL